MRVRLLTEAQAEAQEAARWYDEQQQGLGGEFLEALARGLEAIEESPRACAKVETSQPSREVRRFLLPRFPYRVVYEVLADEVLVLAVAHVRRRPNYWKRRKE